MGKIERISVGVADRERLERLVRDRNTAQKVVWRARIVILASDGLRAGAIAAAVDKSLLTVRRWRRRYVVKGVDGLLKDATRPSRVKPLPPATIKRVVHMTLHDKPPNAIQWSVRSAAKAAGMNTPTTHGLSDDCARATRGLAAAPPTSKMNQRRFIADAAFVPWHEGTEFLT